MRPVNLIPPEQRRGEHAPMRSGPLPYIVVGALVAVLVGVTALVLTGNQISERKGEVATLKREDAEARANAERLAAYTQFRTLHEQRVATVTSLADSRFDWERVMRELSLILPGDVWLTSLNATASPEAETGGTGGGEGGLRADVQGPALEISGCAKGHDGVAGFVTALKDIDGVTRVGVESSKLPEQASGTGVASEGGEGGGSEAGSEGGSSEGCPGRDFIAQFSLVVAFDAAPVPLAGTESAEAPASPTETAETSSTETSESSEGG
jgi:Tfp pilus assembly protein PilN